MLVSSALALSVGAANETSRDQPDVSGSKPGGLSGHQVPSGLSGRGDVDKLNVRHARSHDCYSNRGHAVVIAARTTRTIGAVRTIDTTAAIAIIGIIQPFPQQLEETRIASQKGSQQKNAEGT